MHAEEDPSGGGAPMAALLGGTPFDPPMLFAALGTGFEGCAAGAPTAGAALGFAAPTELVPGAGADLATPPGTVEFAGFGPPGIAAVIFLLHSASSYAARRS